MFLFLMCEYCPSPDNNLLTHSTILINLTGNSSKNQPTKAMDADIRDSIIGMVSIMILEILFCMKLEINFSFFD